MQAPLTRFYNDHKILLDGFWFDTKGNFKNFNSIPFGRNDSYDIKWMAHSFWYLIATEKYFDSHPEYFAEIDGKRSDRGTITPYHNKQLCTSNQNLINEIAGNIIKLFDKFPDKDSIVLGPNDGGGFCECNNCTVLDRNSKYSVHDLKKGNLDRTDPAYFTMFSKRMLKFFTEVAEIVGRQYPNKTIRSPVYSFYRDPPENHSDAIPKNLELMSCRGICHNHSLDNKQCAINRDYITGLKKWIELGARISIYEYYWKNSWVELPFPILRNIPVNQKIYRDIGVSGFTTQYGYNAGTLGPVYYSAFQNFKRCDSDWRELLEEYCDKYFGSAKKPAISYYTLLEEHAAGTDLHFVLPQQASLPIKKIFTKEILSQLDNLSAEIKKLTIDTVYEDFGQAMRVSTDYGKLVFDFLSTQEQNNDANVIRKKATAIRLFLNHGQCKQVIDQSELYIKRMLDENY
ncbi:MAG: hypothetical protein A2096_14040 [Spirochaetes bacterium GWF1_41_5]|nr:MAG: hypothetical protein A2096_14040 [Spirochaetes bacterium GWF1_41_5]